MSNFRPIDRQTGFLLPPSVDDWLPQQHLARFVVEVIDGLASVLAGVDYHSIPLTQTLLARNTCGRDH